MRCNLPPPIRFVAALVVAAVIAMLGGLCLLCYLTPLTFGKRWFLALWLWGGGWCVAACRDFATALQTLARNHRMLYMHAYQSMVWNKAVSLRLQQFGLAVLEGDLVYEKGAFFDRRQAEQRKKVCAKGGGEWGYRSILE